MMNIDDFHERLQMQREQHAGVSFKDIYFYLISSASTFYFLMYSAYVTVYFS